MRKIGGTERELCAFQRPAAGQTAIRKQDFTWTQHSDGNAYVASVLATLDPGTAYQAQSKSEQTLDNHGNLTHAFDNLIWPPLILSFGPP